MIFNKNMLVNLLLIFSLAFNVAFAGIYLFHRTSAEPPHEQRSRDGVRTTRDRDVPGPRRWKESLQLTEEQHRKLESKRKQLSQRMREERRQSAEIRERLVSLLENPDADSEEIARAAEEFHNAQHRIRTLIFDDLLELRHMLDEEQRRKMGDLLKRRYTHPHPEERRGTPQRRMQRESNED